MSISGGGGKESSNWKSNITRTEKPKYQDYARRQIGVLQAPANRAYQQSMYRLLNAKGFNPEQAAEWQKGLDLMNDKWGMEGPQARIASQYLAPIMGPENYMAQLNPYYAAQRRELEGAVPLEQQQYWQDMKRQLGGLWGTSGRGLEQTAEAYGKLRAQQQQRFADLEAAKAAAAQQGMNFTAQNVGQLANMMDPTDWLQKRMGWQAMPEEYLAKQLNTYAQQAVPWSELAMNLADMGYRYPQQVATTEKGKGKGKGQGIGGGLSICWIVRALFGNTGKKTRKLIKLVNKTWPKSFTGRIKYRLYMRFGEGIATYIKKKGAINKIVKNTLRWYFNRQYKKIKGV